MKKLRVWFCSKVVDFIVRSECYADTDDKKKYINDQKEFFGKK